ncbi:ATP-binding response regulator [Eubacterium aggregans]|uniref:sensor histidine kinase n=1 Tax=Eubacterium aggregans TaxID=81409 RepID=UPI003F307458
MINPFCIGDAHRLNRILINLLNNASKFTPEGGKIQFTVYESKTDNAEVTNVHFVVADNGMGIESDKLDKIFEPFYRSGISAINQVEGTGLGLSIVNSIVKARGGTIDVESELGKGATFSVTLPLRIDLANHKSKHFIKQPQSTSLNLSGKVILLVEDHPVNQLVATRLLEKYGAKVCIAENGLV